MIETNVVFILINRNTIKKNPRWPRSPREPCGHITENSEMTFELVERENNKYFKSIWYTPTYCYKKESIEKGEAYSLLQNSEFFFKNKSALPEELQKFAVLDTFPRIIGFTITREVEPVYSLQEEPKYLFEYEPTVVCCSSCGNTFLHTELESDSYNDDVYSNCICPKCKFWDCCEVEFEDIDSIKNDFDE